MDGIDKRVNDSIARYNAKLGETRSTFNTEYRKQLIAEAHRVGMPQPAIDRLKRGKWNG